MVPTDRDHSYFLGYPQLIPWPDRRRGPWVLAAHWVEIDGSPECVGLELWKGVVPEPHMVSTYEKIPGVALEGIGGTDLRELPLATILSLLWEYQREQEAANRASGSRSAAENEWPEEARSLLQEMLAEPPRFVDSGPRRRRSDDLEHFSKVAEVYRQAHRNKRPPTKSVAEHFSVSYSTATKWVARARELNLLGPAQPVKAGAITPHRKRKGTRR